MINYEDVPPPQPIKLEDLPTITLEREEIERIGQEPLIIIKKVVEIKGTSFVENSTHESENNEMLQHWLKEIENIEKIKQQLTTNSTQ